MKAILSSANRLRLVGAGMLAIASSSGAAAPGETFLSLTDFAKDKMFLQRVGTSKSVPVLGTYTGLQPAGVEARVIDADSKAGVTSWMPIGGTVGGGAYMGSIVVPQAPLGQFYQLEVRPITTPGQTVRNLRRFTVGAVVAWLGQSNMVELPKNGSASRLPLGGKGSFQYSRAGTFTRVGNINDALPANTLYTGGGGYGGNYTQSGGQFGDGIVYFTNLLSAGLGVNVCVIERAVGGNAISTWLTGIGGNNWASFVTAINEIGGDFEQAYWLQGESDANTMSTATMKTRLQLLLDQMLAQTGRNSSNFSLGIISLGIGSFSGSSEGEFGNMRAAHVEFARSTSGVFLAACAHDTYTGDGVHIGSLSRGHLGRRIAVSGLAHYGLGPSAAGPYITGAARAGAAIDVAVAHTGGSALTDGALGNGTALTGFEVKVDGVVVPIAATEITGPGAIRLMLGSAPSGTAVVTLSYAMMNNPYGPNATTAPTMAAIAYDNATYHDGVKAPFGRTAVGCPLQPLAAITVTGG